MPGLDEFLAGLTPEANEEFSVLKGVYRAVIKHEDKAETGFTQTTFANGDTVQRFQITVDVVDVLQGNGAAGRRVWLRYNEDERGMKKLLNDLFTANLLDKVDRSSVAQLKATLPNIAESVVYLKAWGWTPEKDRQGNAVAEGNRKSVQQGQLMSEKSVTKLIEKGEATPF